MSDLSGLKYCNGAQNGPSCWGWPAD